MAAFGVTGHVGIVSPDYVIYRPTNTDRLLPTFADLLLRTPFHAAEYLCRSTRVNSSRLRLYPEFYDFIFHTEVYKQQVHRQSTGIVSDRNRLYWDRFKQMPNLTLPRNEQEEIVAFIANETTPLTTAIARTEREIGLMQEYRTRLTADIVTGKLDVRDAAAKLPDVPVCPAEASVPDIDDIDEGLPQESETELEH